MALFQRRPQMEKTPLYSIGAQKSWLIVGLGNPGKQYGNTRHNVGFEAVEEFAKQNEFPGWTIKKDLKSRLTWHNLGENRVILCLPETFMNDSGQAVQAVQQFYKIANSQTLAVYDELVIPFGQLRMRVGGADAGHNGVKSMIAQVGGDFGRLRIGVGPKSVAKMNDADYVLGKFSKAESSKLPQILREAGVVMTEFIFSGELPHDTRTVL